MCFKQLTMTLEARREITLLRLIGLYWVILFGFLTLDARTSKVTYEI